MIDLENKMQQAMNVTSYKIPEMGQNRKRTKSKELKPFGTMSPKNTMQKQTVNINKNEYPQEYFSNENKTIELSPLGLKEKMRISK